MFDMPTLLAVPGAIQSTMTILRELIDSTNTTAIQDKIKKTIGEINNIQESLEKFAMSSRELGAWKQLHHISNRLDTDLAETFPLIASALPENFIRNCNENVRQNISKELISTRRKTASLSELNLFIANDALAKYIVIPQNYNTGGVKWSKRLQDLVDDAIESAKDANLSSLYENLNNLYQLNTDLNNIADDNIKNGIGEFDSGMRRLLAEMKTYSQTKT